MYCELGMVFLSNVSAISKGLSSFSKLQQEIKCKNTNQTSFKWQGNTKSNNKIWTHRVKPKRNLNNSKLNSQGELSDTLPVTTPTMISLCPAILTVALKSDSGNLNNGHEIGIGRSFKLFRAHVDGIGASPIYPLNSSLHLL